MIKIRNNNYSYIMLFIMGIIIMFGFKAEVNAAVLPTDVPDIISLEALLGNADNYSSTERYIYPTITGLTKGQKVTYTSSDANIFVIGYEGEDDFSDGLIEKYDKNVHEIKNNKWSSNEILIFAKNEGTANLTVTISGDGDIPVSKSYTVQVIKPAPELDEIGLKTVIAGIYDVPAFVHVENVFPDYFINISCKQKKVLMVAESALDKGKYVTDSYTFTAKQLGKKEQAGDTDICFWMMKKGTVKFTISVLDKNGEVIVSRDYTLKATAYENPFSSLKIGGKSYKKYFDHYLAVGNGMDAISTKQARYTFGRKMTFKFKKGYTLDKITYMNQNEWRGSSKPHKLAVKSIGNTYKTTFPDKCWDMLIMYKDKKGKKHSVSFYYAAGTVPE